MLLVRLCLLRERVRAGGGRRAVVQRCRLFASSVYTNLVRVSILSDVTWWTEDARFTGKEPGRSCRASCCGPTPGRGPRDQGRTIVPFEAQPE